MAVILKNNNSSFINGDIDTGSGYLGESVYITGVNTNISIIIGAAPLLLTKYYNTYTIQTESSINLTVPYTPNVGLGWYTRIDLVTSTGNGNITILDISNNVIAKLNSITPSTTNLNEISSVNLTLIESNKYSVLYSLPLYGRARQFPIISDLGILVRNSVYANFFSFCDVSTGTVIDANTTTPAPLRWVNPTGQYIDPDYYSVTSNTQINHLQTGTYKYSGLIGITILGGSTLTNLRIRSRLNGVTFLNSFVVSTSQILPFASGSYMISGVASVVAGDYIEFVVDKTTVSAGTNPVDLVNTCMRVELVGQ